jgi:ribosomal protein S18 acetylase RimI-like enzyme
VDCNISYFKRFRMEMDLIGILPEPVLPAGFVFVPWREELLEVHAAVKFACFQDEIDSVVFPSLGSRQGCSQLMSAIRKKPGFLPGATWLVAQDGMFCGTVQGVQERWGIGAIQNLGVPPAFRGHKLGSALLLKALHGFHQAGLRRAILEVTAQNEAAIRLYRRLGFRCRKTVYKAVDTVVAALSSQGSGAVAEWGAVW